MGSKVKPLPCPWCGMAAKLLDSGHIAHVECSSVHISPEPDDADDLCYAQGPWFSSKSADKAIAAWNEIAALRARVRELEALAALGREVVQSVPVFRRRGDGKAWLDGVVVSDDGWHDAVDAAKTYPPRAKEADRA